MHPVRVQSGEYTGAANLRVRTLIVPAPRCRSLHSLLTSCETVRVVCWLVAGLLCEEVWATPSCLMAYFWKDSNFDWRATYAKWRSREYWTFLLPSSLLSVWIVYTLHLTHTHSHSLSDSPTHSLPPSDSLLSVDLRFVCCVLAAVSWLPAVSIIYALPSSLQIPLFCIVCCFWSILLQLIAKTNTAPDGHHSAQQRDDQLNALDKHSATANGHTLTDDDVDVEVDKDEEDPEDERSQHSDGEHDDESDDDPTATEQ